ncbi:MAG TPA: twin-arginine translocase TatA/TatE family subunit, partial [Ilumatobacteraceae bacterium]|nr:twin-arginine translocase TatA/TatE family subunit [Ilumatobacteraceae bacterium]
MFNLSGSELVFLLLLALIVLGPEKLPEAVRKFGRVYSELKKMSTGFQSELKSALDEPMREMRETADVFKKAVNFEFDDEGGLVVSDDV